MTVEESILAATNTFATTCVLLVLITVAAIAFGVYMYVKLYRYVDDIFRVLTPEQKKKLVRHSNMQPKIPEFVPGCERWTYTERTSKGAKNDKRENGRSEMRRH